MGESCNIIGRCRNRLTGKLTSKLSLLHRDLLNIGVKNKIFDRRKANKAFFLSQYPEFLDLYDSELIFSSEDADAEPILASFYEVAKSTMPEVTLGDIRDLLAKKFGEGVYSFEEAQNRMISFNKEMQGAHTFMGTIRRLNDGKYKFEITYNAIEEQNALMLTIADKNFIDIVTLKLAKLGIGIEQSEESMYSTENFNRLANGLLGLIKLKQGERITSDLAKETGHAIIGTLGENNPLVKRLTSIAEKNPEVIAEILGDEEYSKVMTIGSPEKRTRELLGHLVGKYLEDEKNINSHTIILTIKKLISRILDYAKTKFAFTDRDYKQALYDAKYKAYKLARDFLGDNFMGNLDNALNTLETLKAESNVLYQNLLEVIKKLDILADRAKDWGFSAAKSYRDIFSELMTLYNEIGRQIKEAETTVGSFTDNAIHKNTINLIILATRFIINRVTEAQAELIIAMSDKDPLFEERIKDNEICKIIRKNEVLYKEANNLLNQFSAIREAFKGEEDAKQEIKEVEESLRTVLAGIPTMNAAASDIENKGYAYLISQARRKLATRLLVKINGNQFLALEQHVSFDGFLKIKRHPNTIIDLKEELLRTEINPPLDWISTYIDAMLDSPSIINQLIALGIEEKKHEANVKSLEMKDRLFNLYQLLRQSGISSTSMFMEKDFNDEYTGNIISERNWGEWEKRRKNDFEAWRDAWWEVNNHLFLNIREAYRDAIYLEAKESFLKEWHNTNSVKITLLKSDGTPELDELGEEIKYWVPAISTDKEVEGKQLYDGELYRKLLSSNKAEDINAFHWLQEYMKLKKELDALLPSGSTNRFGVRAPLFQGTFTDRLHGAFGGNLTTKEHIKRMGKVTINAWVLQKLGENPSDTEYGGEHDTYDDDDLFHNNDLIFTRAHVNALNSYRRVPLYGVRKLKDPYNVSTDLIHSTLAYASMAYNYNCLEDIIDEVEVLLKLLAELKVDNDKSIAELIADNKRKYIPGTYRRMEDYIELLVYNVYAPIDSKFLNEYRVLNKAIGALTRFSSLYYLQFNLHSAITNAFTGLNEIWKEACGGEDFNRKAFIRAWATFIVWYTVAVKNNVVNWLSGVKTDSGHMGSINESLDFMNLFLKHFDAQNENQRDFRDFHIETPGYQFFKGYSYANIAMSPYSITDKWMQCMAFIATAMSTELIDKDGNKKSVWDAYTVEKGKLVLKKAADETDAQWKILDKNQEAIMEMYKKDIERDTVPKSKSKAVYLFNEDGEMMFDDNNNKILRDVYVPWDNKALTLFKIRCRGINNRLHGVYNSNDGGAYIGYILGPAFASLKKYAIGLIDRRFSKSRHDIRSKRHRQGSTVTIANLFTDYMFTYDRNKIIKMLESDRYKYAKASVNAVLGFCHALCIVGTGAIGMHKILKDRGYSENQIANIRRVWWDNALPEFLRCLLYIVAPPDEQDKTQGSWIIKGLQTAGIIDVRENSDWDDDPWLESLSETMLDVYVLLLKGYRHMPFTPSTFTEDDDEMLTVEYFLDLAERYEKTIPFSIKGMLYYQLYRVILEQDAYNVTSPKGLHGLYSFYSEYKNLTNSSLIGTSALYDVTTLLTQLYENKTEEDLDILVDLKNDYKIYDKYSLDGLELYTKGIYKGFKKASVHAIKVGPLRSGHTWMYGYNSARNMAFWRSRALGLNELEDD